MRITRKRTYYIDPRYRKERKYFFEAQRFDGHIMSRYGRGSRAKIVQHGGGKTPKKAEIDARKKPYRREPKRPISAMELAAERRHVRYLQNDHPQFSRRITPKALAAMKRRLSCDHEWVKTLPQTLTWAERCTKCGSKQGLKNALDAYRDNK